MSFSAASSEQAHRLLADEAIDLALIDCLMSGEQGNSLAEHAAGLGVPTILKSGDPHYLDLLAELSFPFLPKPFRLSALDELISRTLQTRLSKLFTWRRSAGRSPYRRALLPAAAPIGI